MALCRRHEADGTVPVLIVVPVNKLVDPLPGNYLFWDRGSYFGIGGQILPFAIGVEVAPERCRSFAYLLIGLDVVGVLRNGCGMSPATPRDNNQISKAPAPCSPLNFLEAI